MMLSLLCGSVLSGGFAINRYLEVMNEDLPEYCHSLLTSFYERETKIFRNNGKYQFELESGDIKKESGTFSAQIIDFRKDHSICEDCFFTDQAYKVACLLDFPKVSKSILVKMDHNKKFTQIRIK